MSQWPIYGMAACMGGKTILGQISGSNEGGH